MHPVGQRILTVLNDRLGCFVAVIRGTAFARGDGAVIDEFQEVLAVPGDDGEFLAVLAQGIELVGEGSFQFFTCDIAELGLSNQGLGFGADQFLFEDDDAGAVRLLVLELGDLVGDLLLAIARGLYRGFDVSD